MQALWLILRRRAALVSLAGVLAAAAFQPVVAAGLAELSAAELAGLQWREVGPYRGGRSAAVTGVAGDRDVYYFGSTGGGVWKSTDQGLTWKNVSDGFFGGSIGAVAVAPSDPNVIYAGTGEKTVRGNVSHGDGVWKSTDAGRTWSHVGLPESRHIPRLRVHPNDPERVYAAVLGHLFGPNPERGVYRSTDGGKSWKKILYVNDSAGAIDLVFDPTNPRILYAATWRVRRTPYSLESGGEGSGLWKSTDGGDTWTELTSNPGLPEPPIGIGGIAVSPANPDNLYAIVEAAGGGVFRSRDAGKTWERVNQERKLRQRVWYYSRIYADPANEDSVYVVNVEFLHSRDGGKTFAAIATPHGDNHDLWIDPHDPRRMIEGNDGGVNVSTDGGKSWTAQDNQPTAQVYRVSTDNAFPYRLLGGQQDNSALRIRSRSAFGGAIGVRDFEPTAGGESGYVVARPDDPDIVFGGSYGGYLIRVNHRTGEVNAVNPWPDNPMGWGAAELQYRFNWNFPIFFSPHDPHVLYAAANVLFKSADEGRTWQTISPDLTRDLKDKQAPSGGPITKDNTSVEYYGTIFTALESPHEAGVLWAGSDDGRVNLSRDGGKTWRDVTPPGLPDEIQINSIEAHPAEPGGLYVAATAYKQDDFAPYLYQTTDYGGHWKKITRGIAAGHFTRVIRADPGRAGLLYAGTERGLYLSFDDGANWQPVQANLPLTPITDLALKDGDLIAATQGRGFWILDDLSLLRTWDDSVTGKAAQLFAPGRVYRQRPGGRQREPVNEGRNPPAGAALRYWLGSDLKADETLELEIQTADGRTIRTFTPQPVTEDEKKAQPETPDDNRLLAVKRGVQQVVWDLKWPAAEKFDGLVLWNRDLSGPTAVPGVYRAVLRRGAGESVAEFTVVPDPRSSATADDFAAQFEFVSALRERLSEAHRAIAELRAVRSQLAAVKEKIDNDEAWQPLQTEAEAVLAKIEAIEKTLYQTQNESPQDPLNFPIRLTDKLAGVMRLAAFGDAAPTVAMRQVAAELEAAVAAELGKLEAVWNDDLPRFNERAATLGLPAVARPAADSESDREVGLRALP